MKDKERRALKDKFIGAYSTGSTLAVEQSVLEDEIDAFVFQEEVCRALGEALAGWKVGFGADGRPVAGQLWRSGLVESQVRWHQPRGNSGLMVELECGFRLAKSLPPRPSNPYSREEILGACDRILVGIEILNARVAAPPNSNFLLWFADRLGNAGYVVGDSISASQAIDLKNLSSQILINEQLVETCRASHPQGDPILPLVGFANSSLNLHAGCLMKGHIITTGSLITPISIEHPVKISGKISGVGKVELEVVS